MYEKIEAARPRSGWRGSSGSDLSILKTSAVNCRSDYWSPMGAGEITVPGCMESTGALMVAAPPAQLHGSPPVAYPPPP